LSLGGLVGSTTSGRGPAATGRFIPARKPGGDLPVSLSYSVLDFLVVHFFVVSLQKLFYFAYLLLLGLNLPGRAEKKQVKN